MTVDKLKTAARDLHDAVRLMDAAQKTLRDAGHTHLAVLLGDAIAKTSHASSEADRIAEQVTA